MVRRIKSLHADLARNYNMDSDREFRKSRQLVEQNNNYQDNASTKSIDSHIPVVVTRQQIKRTRNPIATNYSTVVLRELGLKKYNS